VWDKALAYFRQAGEKAMARSAHREAAGYFEQALSALAHLPQERATREQAIDLRLALRNAFGPLGDMGRVLAYLRDAESLALALDDPRRLGQVSLFLANYFSIIGAHDQAITAGQRALALATASEEIGLQALANFFLGFAYWLPGNYQRAIDCLRQTMVLLDGGRRHERFGLPHPPAVLCRATLAACHAELGVFVAGIALSEEGCRIAEADDRPGSRMLASWGGGLLTLRQGDLPRALSLLERALSLCQEVDLPNWYPLIATALGAAYTLGGRVADAVPLLTQTLEQTMSTARAGFQAHCSLTLGEAHMLAGRLEEAHALAESALALARAHRERSNEAYALRLLAEIAARRAPPESALAEAYYRQALALAEELGMRPLQAHCHLGLGWLYGQTGRGAQARAALTTAITLYRDMEMTFWLPQAEAVLGQVE
jgi:tetratricopeptide (TPR) repeat protein